MFLELLAGNVDIMRMKPDQYIKASDNPIFRKVFTKKVVLEPEYTYMGYNLARELFKDKRVRRAMTMAIDRNMIVKKVLRNFGTVVTGPFYKNNWAYDKELKGIEYNPDKARILLKEAGFEDIDGDGVLEKDMGSYYLRFSFTLMMNTGNKDRELTAGYIQEYLKKVGIRVKLKYEEWTTFINEYVDMKKFDAIILTWGVSFDPDDTFAVWNSEEIPDIKNGKFGLNSISFVNKEVDELFKKGRLTLDRESRKRCYYRIHEIIQDLQPATFLYSAQNLYAVNKRIKNAQIDEISSLHNITKWWIDK
jgi:peptide/nickel transport system substrate-binding protein